MPRIIRPLTVEDRGPWESLWDGYLAFYRARLSPGTTEHTWQRLTAGDAGMRAFVAAEDGEVIGFVHLVLHPTTWTTTPACYLEDLFVSASRRGGGTGRALIEHVVRTGRAEGWSGIHWLTAQDNRTAMELYDRVATRTTWVRYEIDLAP